MAQGAVELALALYASPSLAGAARSHPLPADMLDLLRIAAGDSEVIELAARRAGCSRRVVVDAARMYLEHALFMPGADHYRVLGTSAGATEEQLRQHRHWLLKWLHPDRNDDDWENVYASRVIDAWQALKTPGQRERYRARLAEGAPHAAAVPAPRVHRPVWIPSAIEPAPAPRWHPSRWRGRGRAVAASCAALAVVAVLLVLQRPPPVSPDRPGPPSLAGSVPAPAPTEVPLSAPPGSSQTPVSSGPPVPVSGAAAEAAYPSGTASTSTTGVMPEDAVASSTPVATSAPAFAGEVVDPTPDARPEPAPAGWAWREPRMGIAEPVAAQGPALPPADPDMTGSSLPAAPVASIPMSPVAGPAADTAELSAMERLQAAAAPDVDRASALLESLQVAYAGGDVDALMALFASHARNNRGDRQAIREDYRDLFRNSQRRNLDFHDLGWSRQGDTATGEGRFTAEVVNLRGNAVRVTGSIRVEVVHEDASERIQGLWHQEEAVSKL